MLIVKEAWSRLVHFLSVCQHSRTTPCFHRRYHLLPPPVTSTFLPSDISVIIRKAENQVVVKASPPPLIPERLSCWSWTTRKEGEEGGGTGRLLTSPQYLLPHPLLTLVMLCLCGSSRVESDVSRFTGEASLRRRRCGELATSLDCASSVGIVCRQQERGCAVGGGCFAAADWLQ